MAIEIFLLNKFIEEKKLQHGAKIVRAEFVSFCMKETKNSISAIYNYLASLKILGFFETDGKNYFILNKKKFDEWRLGKD